MDEYNSIKDWMSSHDTHSHGIRYDSIDLEDEVAYPLEGPIDVQGTDGMEDMIDESRELADIFVAYLSEYEACACAMIFGKSHNHGKDNGNRLLLNKSEIDRIKHRLSKLFDEFVLDYPELAISGMFKTLFSENVLERCENIYKIANRRKIRK